MTLTISRQDNRITCRAGGKLDDASTREFEELQTLVSQTDQPSVELDFADVSGCDAGGVILLAQLAGQVRRMGGTVTFLTITPELRSTLRLLRLDALIPFPAPVHAGARKPRKRAEK